MAAIVGIVSRCGLKIEVHRRNQPNKRKLVLYKPLLRLYSQTCVICTGVVWLGSPATIALSVLRAHNEAICKLTAWDIVIPVKVLLVIWCVLIN